MHSVCVLGTRAAFMCNFYMNTWTVFVNKWMELWRVLASIDDRIIHLKFKKRSFPDSFVIGK